MPAISVPINGTCEFNGHEGLHWKRAECVSWKSEAAPMTPPSAEKLQELMASETVKRIEWELEQLLGPFQDLSVPVRQVLVGALLERDAQGGKG